MALRHIDSFDHYDTAKSLKKGWSYVTQGASPGDTGGTIGSYGRNSTQGLRCKSTSGAGNVGLATLGVTGVSGATAIIGFAFRIESSLPDTTITVVQVQNASAPQVSVTCSTGGALSVRRGGIGGTVLATGATTLSVSTWYFLELKVLFNDSTGTYELKIDGVSEVSGTGADTIASGSAGWDSIVLGTQNVSTTCNLSYDDLYCADGSGGVEDTFLGDHRVVAIVASSGNGANTDWTPSTGSDHGAVVDENPPNETDYNLSGTSGQRDTYAFAAVGVTGTVKALQTLRYIKADVAGVRSVGSVTRIGSTNYDGAGQVVGSDWTYQREIARVSPATAAAWTISEIDGAEFGAKVTA